MSRNNVITTGLIVITTLLAALGGGGDETSAPDAEAESPEPEASECQLSRGSAKFDDRTFD